MIKFSLIQTNKISFYRQLSSICLFKRISAEIKVLYALIEKKIK